MLALVFHRRRLRRTTWVMLLAWVLALSAGVVNACQLQPHGLESHASISSTPHGGHGLHDGDNNEGEDAGKAGCLKFCDDGSSSVPQSKSAATDVPCPVVLACLGEALASPAGTGPMQRLLEQAPAHGPPLVIRFLRLTI